MLRCKPDYVNNALLTLEHCIADIGLWLAANRLSLMLIKLNSCLHTNNQLKKLTALCSYVHYSLSAHVQYSLQTVFDCLVLSSHLI